MRKDSFANQKLDYPLTSKTWHLQAWVKPKLSLVTLSELIPHLKMWQCKHSESRWYGRGDTSEEAYKNWAWLHTCYGVYFYLPENASRLRREEINAKGRKTNLPDHV